MAVQPWGDKSPHLVHQPRQHHQDADHHQHLERHKKGREHAHGNQLGIGRHVRLDGLGNEIDQPIGAGPDGQHHHRQRHAIDAVQQAVAQLNQMLDEGLLGASQFVVGGGSGGHV